MQLIRRLAAILGKRAFLSFGVVTFLVTALLATVNITSRYALKLYVEDQLERTPWDLSLFQKGGSGLGTNIPDRVRSVQGIKQVENLVFLRAMFPQHNQVMPEVDGKPLSAPWICMMAATDPGVLPPQLSLALGNRGAAGGDAAVLALLGPEQSIGRAFLSLQGAKEFEIKVAVGEEKRSLFTTPVAGVMRLGREELNRWLIDQVGSISFVPHIGVVLLMPYHSDMLRKFDMVASGLVPPELMGSGEADFGHVQTAEYFPDVIYLARVNRQELISGWDIAGSLDRVRALASRIRAVASRRAASISDSAVLLAHNDVPRLFQATDQLWGGVQLKLVHDPSEDDQVSAAAEFMVDSTTLVLLERMQRIARIIGLITFLIALPLLWMAWVLAANLSGLLMLNERRKLGLMRLRGVPGQTMGWALLLAIVLGGFLGGVLGLIIGSVIPLLIYEKGRLPVEVLLQPQQVFLLWLFLAVTLFLALLVSRRLVRYATTISPLEASGRVAKSEATRTAARFGALQIAALLLGSYVMAGWIFNFSLAFALKLEALRFADQALNFLGLPLFLYGVATLLAFRRNWIQSLLAPVIQPIAGCLGLFALRHVSVKPHRTLGFLLIVALMGSVCLYPTVAGDSFEDKAVRGARVQMGTEWQITLNSPDLVGVDKLQGRLQTQLAALRPAVQQSVAGLSRVPGVKSVTYLAEALLPNFYLPGYGLRGVPLYVIGDSESYARNIYAEPELGITDRFTKLLDRLNAGDVVVSPPVADFWRLSPDTSVLVGLDDQRRAVFARSGGTFAFLPGMPPRTVTDRQGFVQARVDYLNYLLSDNAYLAAASDNSKLSDLQVLIPRVILLVNVDEGAALNPTQSDLIRALPTAPLEVHNLRQEIQKVGSDMFISLALANLRIYLLGGLALALIAILAVAMANYAEDHRTLALLRIRGASLMNIWRFLVAMLFSPALLGLILGGVVALVAGYGLTNYIWKLREIKTVVQFLPTRPIISPLTGGIAVLLLILLLAIASIFSFWVFRRTARETIQEG